MCEIILLTLRPHLLTSWLSTQLIIYFVTDSYLAVDCKSVWPGQHWGGIQIFETSPSSSSLQYVQIQGAGVRNFNVSRHRLTPALFVNGSNVKIRSEFVTILVKALVRGRTFDSWGGGGGYAFLGEKDCSANNGK